MKDDIKNTLHKIATELPKQALTIIKVEGLNFIKQNFQDQGFNDGGIKKWDQRKTTDRKRRDITRYRTNRKGKQGDLTKFGRENENRAILVGHNTAGDKLKNSFTATVNGKTVTFQSNKNYAQTHNKGIGNMPPRPFIGDSQDLKKNIDNKINQAFKNLIK